MSIVAFLIVGLLAGWIASSVVEGHGMGAIGDIVIGVIGAFVGGFVFDIFGVTSYGFWGALLMSVLGAIVFLFVAGLFSGSQKLQKPLRKH